jgi:hydrogenase/urease accessory protein HupE
MRQLFILLAIIPSTAFAHAPIDGVNHFLNGALHPIFVPAHIILLVGLGLLIGRQGNTAINKVVPIFMITVIVGVLLSMWSISLDLVPILLILAIILGNLLIWGKMLAIWMLRLIAVIAALLVGFDSPQETFFGKERYIALFGTVFGTSFIVAYVAGITEIIRQWLNGIPIRVLGSWLVAGSLMALWFLTCKAEMYC